MTEILNNRTKTYSEIAEKCIRQLLDEFVKNPHNFFSESDVKCRLFALLFQHPQINIPMETMNGGLVWPLHTEVSYFDDDGKLFFHVDLSAVDPAFTEVHSNWRNAKIILRKGYRAGVCYFAVELKLNKIRKIPRMFEAWQKDMVKLENIKSRNKLLTCFSILFDKKGNAFADEQFKEIVNKHPQVKIL
jgi:hypothetical protein